MFRLVARASYVARGLRAVPRVPAALQMAPRSFAAAAQKPKMEVRSHVFRW